MRTLYRLVGELQKGLAEAHEELARLRWAHEHSIIHGPVTDRDSKKGIRVQIGVDEAGAAVKSSWLPPSQIAGARKSWSLPSLGQQMTLLCPCGDVQRAMAAPFTWSDRNPPPSDDMDADVEVRGKTRTTRKDVAVTREVDGVTESLTKQSCSLTVHKDVSGAATVDDAHPWSGNGAEALHGWTFTKDGGLEMRINMGGDEHRVKLHPTEGVTISGFGDQHSVAIGPNGISHRSSARVTIQAPQIAHDGALKVTGSILAAGVVKSSGGFLGNLQGLSTFYGFAGGLPEPTDWS